MPKLLEDKVPFSNPILKKNISTKNCIIFKYSQTCEQRPPLGLEKCGRYAEGCLKKISGK
jgi:hypothetical protein